MRSTGPKLAFIAFVAASAACSVGGSPTPVATSTLDTALTARAQTAVAQAVEIAQAGTQAVESTLAAQATARAEAAQATGTAEYGLTATPARATDVAAARQSTREAATAQVIIEATAQAQPMAETIRQLVADGHLGRGDGVYYALPDYLDSWAQLDWYAWTETGYTPADFVIRADTAWESASTTANWWNSGCGFVFREVSEDNHYLIYLGLDGIVYMSKFRNGVYNDVGSGTYGKVDVPNGVAQVMLVAEGNTFKFFVNGERVLTQQDGSFDSGRLNLTLVSGTNKGFGTLCKMTKVELWELK